LEPLSSVWSSEQGRRRNASRSCGAAGMANAEPLSKMRVYLLGRAYSPPFIRH
jgi:NurA-like 5'-3' nuclease